MIGQQSECLLVGRVNADWLAVCAVCRSEIGLPPYSKVSASSEKNQGSGSNCQAEDGYILTNKAWCAKDNNSQSLGLAISSNNLAYFDFIIV